MRFGEGIGIQEGGLYSGLVRIWDVVGSRSFSTPTLDLWSMAESRSCQGRNDLESSTWPVHVMSRRGNRGRSDVNWTTSTPRALFETRPCRSRSTTSLTLSQERDNVGEDVRGWDERTWSLLLLWRLWVGGCSKRASIIYVKEVSSVSISVVRD